MRRTIFIVHQYLGFTVGIYLIVICATGAMLVLLENQIDGFRDYPMRRVQPGQAKTSLDAMVAVVERAYPGDTVTHVLKSCDVGCTYDVTINRANTGRVDVLVNPYTGAIVDTIVWNRSPIGFLYDLHANLLNGDYGSTINSSIGLIAVLQVLLGLYLWPGWMRIKRGFSIKWRADQWRLNFDLHKVVGIVSLIFLIYIVCTGAAGVFFAEPQTGAPQIAATHHASKALALDNIVAIADRALPGAVTMVYPASQASELVRVRKVVRGDPDPYGWSNVWVNQYSGQVVAVYNSARWPLWWRIYTYFYPLHIGSVGGYVLRYIFVVFALTPIALYFTAFLMWINRLKRDEAVATARRLEPQY
jgi:uncharacterized iron-regulated membrane protein